MAFEQLIGTSWSVFVVFTVVIMGFAALMTGRAVAETWKPWWHVAIYSALLGCADRFLTFALFEGELLSPSGYVIDLAVLLAIASGAYRFTLARRMARQYPWLYERTGPFSWRARD